MKNTRSRFGGFTLVELMIALSIALVAILAATQLYLSTRQTYRIQGMQATLSEDGRFALSMLQRIFTQAGFRPAPNLSLGGGVNPVTATSATSATVRFIADGTNQVGCDGAVLANGGNAVQALTISSGNGKLQCGAVDWIAPAGASSELVDFRLDYGVDNAPTTAKDFGCGPDVVANVSKAGDCVADTYVLATAQASPSQIVAIKACLVLRSETLDRSLLKAAAYKDCSDNDIANSQTDNRLYRTFRSTILIRNR